MHAWSLRSSHFKQISKDHNHGSSLPSASSRHFIMIKVQAHQASSILNGSRRSKWPNFASLHIWFATSWLSLKFVSLFHVSIFFWIQEFHVEFNELCLCIYIKKKKKFKISKSFPKKEKFFQMKKIFELGTLNFLVTFSKRPILFFSNISRFFKVFFSKWYTKIPWTKHFLNCDV